MKKNGKKQPEQKAVIVQKRRDGRSALLGKPAILAHRGVVIYLPQTAGLW